MRADRRRRARALGIAAALAFFATSASAQQQTASVDELLSRPLALVVALALVGFLPFLFMALTSFVKISTVLQIARSALGAQNVPSNMVVLALAAALSLVAMAPVGSRIADRVGPLIEPGQERDGVEQIVSVVEAAVDPMRAFLRANASERERNRFYELAREARPADERNEVGRDDLTIVIPAFMITELIEAFALGFAIYLPFLVLDLVVGNVLLALGMQTLSVTQVSLPFKLLLFVAIDGWGLLAESLVTGYALG